MPGTLWFQIVGRIFMKEDVVHHHRLDGLGGLELVIFVPSLDLAFEYQGERHFHPVEIWRGNAALEETRVGMKGTVWFLPKLKSSL